MAEQEGHQVAVESHLPADAQLFAGPADGMKAF